MKKIYSEPMTKVMFLNVNAPICESDITESPSGNDNPPVTEEPLF